MRTFLGKTIKFLLWGLLFVLLGAFLFWLLKFKGNVSEYITYLNQISIKEIFSSQQDIPENIIETGDNLLVDDTSLDQEFSGMSLDEDDYFLPEATSWDSLEPFWFSWSLEQTWTTGETKAVTSGVQENKESSTSKEELMNLIKSREK